MKKNCAYAINESKAISETLEGETIIVNLENGTYYSVNETGSILWNLIKERASYADITEAFAKRYTATTEVIEQATGELIDFLKRENLIFETDTESAERKKITQDM